MAGRCPWAVVTTIFFTIGKALIAWYTGNSAVASSYGAAGALIVLLLWIYLLRPDSAPNSPGLYGRNTALAQSEHCVRLTVRPLIG
jgi:hypothetical protein